MSEILSLPDAVRLAQMTLRRIDAAASIAVLPDDSWGAEIFAADRARVESDLAGLRACHVMHVDLTKCELIESQAVHARRYSDGLRRTAALYGVTS